MTMTIIHPDDIRNTFDQIRRSPVFDNWYEIHNHDVDVPVPQGQLNVGFRVDPEEERRIRFFADLICANGSQEHRLELEVTHSTHYKWDIRAENGEPLESITASDLSLVFLGLQKIYAEWA